MICPILSAHTHNVVKFNFYGDELDIVKDGETLWISVRRVCEALGIDESTQRKKLKSKEWAITALKTALDVSGRNFEQFMIDLDSLTVWLVTVDANRVANGMQNKLKIYQTEAKKALKAYFFGTGAVRISIYEQRRIETQILMDRHEAIIRSLKILADTDIFSPDYIKRKIEHSLATVSGAEVSNSSKRTIDVSGYLEGKGLTKKEIRKIHSNFGKLLKALYVEKYGENPRKCEKHINGADRLVNAYTEKDLDLFDKIWKTLLESRPLIAKRYEQPMLSDEYDG